MTDISFYADQVRAAAWEAAGLISAPHSRMHPKVFPDGDQWCALYGDDLQEGVAGFGETPDKACVDFDNNWFRQTLQRGRQTP